MYKRLHHQRIARILEALDADFLRENKCYFGGGTAIALLLDEYRESVDIDFMCADQEGYRNLRTAVFQTGLQHLFWTPIETLREVRADQYGVRSVLAVEGIPVKFEIVREARITLSGVEVDGVPVLVLARNDLFAEKLLANVDRYADRSVMSRDVIDLLVMEDHWGTIPKASIDKAAEAYGTSVRAALDKAKDLLRDHPGYLQSCLEKMGIEPNVGRVIKRSLGIEKSNSLGMGF